MKFKIGIQKQSLKCHKRTKITLKKILNFEMSQLYAVTRLTFDPFMAITFLIIKSIKIILVSKCRFGKALSI